MVGMSSSPGDLSRSCPKKKKFTNFLCSERSRKLMDILWR